MQRGAATPNLRLSKGLRQAEGAFTHPGLSPWRETMHPVKEVRRLLAVTSTSTSTSAVTRDVSCR